jgi:hypothetical protein
MTMHMNESTRLTMSCGAEYRVCVQGVVDRGWVDDFSRMVVSYRDRGTAHAISILIGWVQDQAELLGLVNNLYGLGLPLISVRWRTRRVSAGPR